MATSRFVSRLIGAAERLRALLGPQTVDPPVPSDTPQAAERQGKPTQDRPEGCLMWLHAATPSETGASLALAQELARLRAEPIHTLITTNRNGSLIPAIAKGAVHQLAPSENTESVRRFLAHWKPDVGVFLGPPDRPILISQAKESGTLLFLAASERGDASEKPRLPNLSVSLLGNFRVCLAASAADAQVYRRDAPGKGWVEIIGPLSDTSHAIHCNEGERDTLARLLGGRPVWLAAQVTADEIVASELAQRRALQAAHRLLLIIVPRNPDDGPAIAETLEGQGWHTSLRSAGGEPAENVQIHIADTIDEMGLWYRLAPITFIGGSLTATSEPSDPFEPAALGSVVVHGPNLGRSESRFTRLADAGANYPIMSATDLGAAILTLLAPDRAAKLAHAGWSATTESAPVVERLAQLMDEALDERDVA